MTPLKLARTALGVGDEPRVTDVRLMLNGVNVNPVAAPIPIEAPAGIAILIGVGIAADRVA
jgi:hypothetical protein